MTMDTSGQGVVVVDDVEDGLAARVDHGCARILRRNAIPSIATNIVLSCLVAAVAWLHDHQETALTWLAASVAVNILRLIITRGFDFDADPTAVNIRSWPRRYAFAACLSGLVWGCVGFLFIFPDQSRTPPCFLLLSWPGSLRARFPVPHHFFQR